MITYDNRFNANEWYVLSALFIGVLIVFLLPRRFQRKQAIIYFMCGVFTGFFFDHTLSVQPFSFYDVNDNSNFNIMDFISYWMYGPYSYLFFYILDSLRIRPSFGPVYVFVSSLVSLGFEWLAQEFGVFHYRHGYTIYGSFTIYLIVQSAWFLMYYRFSRNMDKKRS